MSCARSTSQPCRGDGHADLGRTAEGRVAPETRLSTTRGFAPPLPDHPPATPDCGYCSSYVLQLIALSNERCVREEELQILRAAQRECASMAGDIHSLHVCIEEQRQHIVKLSRAVPGHGGDRGGGCGGVSADPGIGLFSLMNDLSRKHAQVIEELAFNYNALQMQYQQQSADFQATLDAVATQALQHRDQESRLLEHYNTLSTVLETTREELAAARRKNAEDESLITLINETADHFKREIEVQYECIREQQRHMSTAVTCGAAPDSAVGLSSLLNKVKHNEFQFYAMKMSKVRAQLQAASSAEVEKASAILSRHLELRYTATMQSSWREFVALREQFNERSADAERQQAESETARLRQKKLNLVFTAILAHTRKEHEARTNTENSEAGAGAGAESAMVRLRQKKLHLVFTAILARKEREVRAHVQTLTEHAEAERAYSKLVAGTFQKLKAVNLRLNKSETARSTLTTINEAALKSRDAVQLMLRESILEKQRLDAEATSTAASLERERAEHAAARVSLQRMRSRLCAMAQEI
jgi:hypothetical protein